MKNLVAAAVSVGFVRFVDHYFLCECISTSLLIFYEPSTIHICVDYFIVPATIIIY